MNTANRARTTSMPSPFATPSLSRAVRSSRPSRPLSTRRYTSRQKTIRARPTKNWMFRPVSVEVCASLRNLAPPKRPMLLPRTSCCFTIARPTSARPIVKRAKYTPRRRIVGAAMIAPISAPNAAAPSSMSMTFSDRALSMSDPACEPPEMYAPKYAQAPTTATVAKE